MMSSEMDNTPNACRWRTGISTDELHAHFVARRQPQRERLTRAMAHLREHDPRRCRRLIDTARRTMTGWVNLDASDRPVFVGASPNWHRAEVDGVRMDGLRRFNHLLPVIEAGVLTGDDAMLAFVAAQVDDWIAACPLPELPDDPQQLRAVLGGPVPWNSLDASHRLFQALVPIMDVLAGTPHLDEARFDRWLGSIHDHGRVLAFAAPLLKEPSSNIFMMYSLGLLAAATLGVDFAEHEAWLAQSVDWLDACAREQLSEDGAQLEATPGYHCVCVNMMLQAILLLKDSDRTLAAETIRRVEAGVWHSLHAARPTGELTPIGDANPDGSNLGVPVLAFAALDDPAPLLALRRLLMPSAFRHAIMSGPLTSADPARIIAAIDEAAEADTLPPRIAHQRQVKQVMLRTAWKRDAAMVYLNCQTVESNGHSDQDPCGFDYTALGRPLLIDPGRVEYKESEQRRRFRSATSHNTVTVDHREPYDYRSQWFTSPVGETGIEFVQDCGELLAVSCYQRNYAPVEHRRALVLIGDRALLILDAFTGLHWAQSVQRYFHFPTPHVRLDAAAAQAVLEGDAVAMMLRDSGTGEAELLPGEFAPRMGRAYPTARLLFDDLNARQERRTYAAVAVPYRAGDVPPFVGRPEIAEDTATPETYHVTVEIDETTHRFRWTPAGVLES